MYSVPIIPGRRLKSALGSLIAFMLAFVVTSNLATAQRDTTDMEGCIDILEQKVECKLSPNGATGTYEWCFAFLNTSNRTITYIQAGNNGTRIDPVPPGGRGYVCIDVYGRPGATTQGIAACSYDSTYIPDSGRNGAGGKWIIQEACCEQSIPLRLPECEQNPEECLTIVEQAIKCAGKDSAFTEYEWCFVFRNETAHPVTFIRVGNRRIQTGYVAPGGNGRACVTLTGNPGTVQAYVLTLCSYDTIEVRDSAANGRIDWEVREHCCETRVTVRLPDCNPHEGCIDIVEQTIKCLDVTAAGTNAYEWCFTFINTSDVVINNIQVGNSSVTVDPVPPGGTGRACVRIFGRPGPAGFVLTACSMGRNNDSGIFDPVCCTMRVELKLPECDPHGEDCCSGFEIGLANLAPVAAPNGLTGLLGAISAGQNNIKKASATIVSATVNGQPAFGYFNSGLILNPLGAGTVTPPPFGQELIWNAPAGVNMNAPSLTLEWLRFPPMAPNARVDTLSFCIRWRFTDTECRTCDTLVCYSVVRNQFLLRDLQGTSEKGTSALGGNNGFVNGELTGQNTATLSIELPTLPANDFGDITYTGITIQADEGVQISAVNSDQAAFSTQLGLAIAQISAKGGTKFDMNISYDNLNNRPALGHFALLGYESSLAPGIQQQLPLTVTLRQAGTDIGGDQVQAVKTEIQGAKVETFALHLKNANNTSETLNGLRITTGGGVKLLAVGPTSSDEEALLRFGAAGESGRAYVSEASEGTMQLAPGAERNPIYLTVSYDGELPPVVNYATLNGLDEVVSEGTVDLTQVSSVHNADGVTGTSIGLGESHPNPTTGQATISLRLSEREQVNLVLRDARGSEVARLLDGEVLESGIHVVNADVSGLSNGVYFYTLETPTGSQTRQLVVRK